MNMERPRATLEQEPAVWERMMKRGDVLEYIQVTDALEVERLRSRLTSGSYDARVVEYLLPALDALEMPLIKDKFSDQHGIHESHRRPWERSLPDDERRFLERNIIGINRIGALLQPLQVIPHLVAPPADLEGKKRAAAEGIAKQADALGEKLTEPMPEGMPAYDALDHEHKIATVFSIRDFALGAIESILNLYEKKR